MALPSRNRPRRRVRRTECILVFFVCWFLRVDWLRRTAVPKAVPASCANRCGQHGGNGSGEAWPSSCRRTRCCRGGGPGAQRHVGIRLCAARARDRPAPLPAAQRHYGCRRLDARPPPPRPRHRLLPRARPRDARARRGAPLGACALTCRVYVDDRPLRTHTPTGLHALLAPCSRELRGLADGARRCRQPLRREGGRSTCHDTTGINMAGCCGQSS